MGYNCYVSWTLRKIGIQKGSYPIDWVNSFRFSRLLDFIDEFSIDSLKDFEPSPIDADAASATSYYITRYAMRFPHEHDLNPGISIREISERYARRFERLRAHCKAARHIVFLRTNAVRTYNLAPEDVDEYSPDVILKAARVLGDLVGHNRFTLAILRERLEVPAIDAPFIAQANLLVPFENGFYDADMSQPRKAEAFNFFRSGLAPIQKAGSTAEVKKVLVGLSAAPAKRTARALGFPWRDLLH
jgi:hypothetical protein